MVQPNYAAAHRLLAVEDDADCSELIVRTAVKCGYVAMAAADATEMVAAIENWRPHVITLDLCLPHVDGIEVISAIKEAGFAGPVIIVSGQPDWIREFTSKAAAECGLSVPAHMSKPWTFASCANCSVEFSAACARYRAPERAEAAVPSSLRDGANAGATIYRR